MDTKEYICNICKYTNTDKDNLNRHVFEHSCEKLVQICNYCNKWFEKNSEQFTEHMLDHTCEKNNNPKNDSTSLDDLDSSKVNAIETNVISQINIGRNKSSSTKQVTILKVSKWKCSSCDSSFMSMNNLKCHMLLNHSKNEKINCNICKFNCEEKLLFKKHMLTHTKPVLKTETDFKSESIKEENISFSNENQSPYYSSPDEDNEPIFSKNGIQKGNNNEKSKYEKQQSLQYVFKQDFQCHICNYTCFQSKDLKNHLVQAHSDREDHQVKTHSDKDGKQQLQFVLKQNLQCHICNYTCFQSKDLKDHLVKSHSDQNVPHDKKLFECSQCSYSSKQKRLLTQHMIVHQSDKPFQCTYCDYRTKRKECLNIHIAIHSGLKPFQCEVCGHATQTKANLLGHKRKHHSNQVITPVTCNECGKTYNSKYQLRAHLEEIHQKGAQYNCKECDYTTFSRKNLKKHGLTHSGHPFQCEICGYSCAFKNLLVKHFRVHTNETPYECTVCSKSYKYSTSLRQHMMTHTNEKPFKCSECDYSTSRKNKLKTHSVVHSGLKPYQCETCGFTCAHKFSLRKHFRVHTGERNYKCNLCSKTYKSSDGLLLHKRVHTGERPYQCDFCDYAARHSTHLKTHMKTHMNPKRSENTKTVLYSMF